MPRPGRKWILATLVGAIVLAIGFYVAGSWLQLCRLAAFTYFYSGYNIFAQPSFDIPRLPPAENFELVGHIGGRPSAVSVAGKYAYVGYGSDLVVIDAGDPAYPKIVASLTLLSPVRDITVSGSRAYVADGRGGLRVIDVSEPRKPRELSNFGHRAAVAAVAVKGDTAYLASGVEGVQVLDCADASKLRLSGFNDAATENYGTLDATTVATAGDHLYVTNGGSELRVLNTGTPRLPRLIGTAKVKDGSELTLAAEGDLLVVGGGSPTEGLWIYSMASGRPALISFVKVPQYWYANGVVMSHGYIYVATGSGLLIVDARKAEEPVMLSEYKMNSGLTDIATDGDRAFVATMAGDFVSIDISDRRQPKVLGVMNYPGTVASAALCKDSLIIGSGPGALFGCRKSPQGLLLKEPRYLAKCEYPRYVACSGNTIAVYHESSGGPGNNRDWLQVSYPDGGDKLTGQIDIPVPDARLRPVFGSKMLAVGGYKGLYIAETPLDPRHVKTSFTSFPHSVEELAARESVLFVATDRDNKIAELRAYEAANPEKLRLLQTIPLPDSIDGLCVSGKYLYVTAGPFLGKNSLMVFDVSSPTGLKRLSSTPLFGGTTVDVDDGVAYVEEVGRVSAIDVSDPHYPTVIGKIETTAVPMSVTDLFARDGLLYLSADDAGLYVYRLNRRSGRSKGQ